MHGNAPMTHYVYENLIGMKIMKFVRFLRTISHDVQTEATLDPHSVQMIYANRLGKSNALLIRIALNRLSIHANIAQVGQRILQIAVGILQIMVGPNVRVQINIMGNGMIHATTSRIAWIILMKKVVWTMHLVIIEQMEEDHSNAPLMEFV